MKVLFRFFSVTTIILTLIAFACTKNSTTNNDTNPNDTAIVMAPDTTRIDSISLTSFRAVWNQVSGVDSYMVVLCTGSDSAIDTFSTVDTTYKISGFTVNHCYLVHVYGCSSNVWSDEYSKCGLIDIYTFRAPINVKLDSTWTTGAKITFDGSEDYNLPGMVSYRVYIRDQDGEYLDSVDIDTSARSASISGLQSEKAYKLSIVTVGNLGVGEIDSNCYCDTSSSGYNTLRLTYIYVSTYSTPSMLTDSLAPVKGGIFRMGYIWDHHADVSILANGPQHEVIISSFHMSKYEVTASQYCAFLNSKSSAIQFDGSLMLLSSDTIADTIYSTWPLTYNASTFSVKSGKSNYPMIGVLWHGAAAFCNYYSKLNSLDTCYNSQWVCNFNKNGYRLPTEAEFEYAASAGFMGEKRRFAWGFAWDTTKGAVDLDGPVSVGNYTDLNGVYDLTGNVMEWVNDWSDVECDGDPSTYYTECLQNGVVTDPCGPSVQIEAYKHMMRGGSFEGSPKINVTTFRYTDPCNNTSDYGFRMARKAQ